jgi:hypothetical protein
VFRPRYETRRLNGLMTVQNAMLTLCSGILPCMRFSTSHNQLRRTPQSGFHDFLHKVGVRTRVLIIRSPELSQPSLQRSGGSSGVRLVLMAEGQRRTGKDPERRSLCSPHFFIANSKASLVATPPVADDKVGRMPSDWLVHLDIAQIS